MKEIDIEKLEEYAKLYKELQKMGCQKKKYELTTEPKRVYIIDKE